VPARSARTLESLIFLARPPPLRGWRALACGPDLTVTTVAFGRRSRDPPPGGVPFASHAQLSDEFPLVWAEPPSISPRGWNFGSLSE